MTNVGSFDPITPQPNRTIDAEMNLAWDNSTGPHKGRVYLVYLDEVNASGVPTDETNNTDVFLRYSDDNGTTWSKAVKVNDNPDSDMTAQFQPAIAVDQTTGNVAIAWLDCRNDPANKMTEVYATVSTDGGVTWDKNVKLSGGQSVAPPGGFDFGDYNKMTFDKGVFYYSWADNSNSTGDNPAGVGGATDVYTVPVTVSGGGGGGVSGATFQLTPTRSSRGRPRPSAAASPTRPAPAWPTW